MKSVTRIGAVAAATAAFALGMATTATAATTTRANAVHPESLAGCPRGAVCIYPRDTPTSAGPEAGGIYWSYGAHNLHNQFGYHYIVNNQYGGASYKLCYGYNGVNCTGSGEINRNGQAYLTPINSILLVR